MTKAIFIAGTDTGVGKTVICGLLAGYLAKKGKKAITQKWVQTGCGNFSGDIRLHDKISGLARKNYAQLRCPYLFAAAVSPHLAARLEKKRINPEKIKQSFKLLSRRFDYLLVEGTGGLLVPYSGRGLLIDIAQELKLPVLLVAQNKLGAINHTLLALEALDKRKIKILGMVFNQQKGEEKIVLKDNPRIIRALSKIKVFGMLPYSRSVKRLTASFAPIGKKICRALGS